MEIQPNAQEDGNTVCVQRIVSAPLGATQVVKAALRVAYITDLERRQSGGGSYGVNWHAFDQLQRRFAAIYAGPLVPRPRRLETAISRLQRRILKRRGRFTYFSPSTLERNARMAAPYINGVDAVMFRSAARWCRCRPTVPYFIYLDVVFHTFFRNTFSESHFDQEDLQRIWNEEKEFLEGAAGVFFESQWGLDEAKRAYGLEGSHYSAPGRGGMIDPPASDAWDGTSRELISMAFDFRQKGGDVTLEAFRSLKARFPALSWRIIGGPPGGDWRSSADISYEGFLSPDNEEELRRLRNILANAFLLVHPTREDTSPLVVTEAAAFGCPAISVNAFAIPELVENGVTGLLVDPPATGDTIAAAIADLLIDDSRYRRMRAAARNMALQRHSWDSIGAAICDTIKERLFLPGTID